MRSALPFGRSSGCAHPDLARDHLADEIIERRRARRHFSISAVSASFGPDMPRNEIGAGLKLGKRGTFGRHGLVSYHRPPPEGEDILLPGHEVVVGGLVHEIGRARSCP